MKISKISRALAVAALLTVGTAAAHATICLVVKTTEGTTTSFVLADQPKLTFPDGKLIVTATEATTEFALADVDRFYFEDIDESVKPAKKETRITYLDGVAVVEGVKGSVQVVDAQGRLVATAKAGHDRTARIDLNDAEAGTYILQAGDQTVKLLRK